MIHGMCKHRTSYIPPHSKLFRSDMGRFQVEYLAHLFMNGLETNCVVTPRCLVVWKRQQNWWRTVSWFLIAKYSTKIAQYTKMPFGRGSLLGRIATLSLNTRTSNELCCNPRMSCSQETPTDMWPKHFLIFARLRKVKFRFFLIRGKRFALTPANFAGIAWNFFYKF